MGIFLQFKHPFYDQSYLSVITIHFYFFFHSSSTFLVQETASKKKKKKKKKTGRNSLINIRLILISNLLKYFTALLHEHLWQIKHCSPDSIQKCADE